MSDTGVLSGIFGQLGRYSLALNLLLVTLKADGPSARFMPPRELGELIGKLRETWHADLSIQALANALDSASVACDRDSLARLQQAFQSCQSYPEFLADLEGLARLVRAQQSGAFMRLRHPK
jgi:hypothetical protein